MDWRTDILNDSVAAARGMTSDQRYSEGFKHGSTGRGFRGILSSYSDYVAGYRDGFAQYRASGGAWWRN